MDKPLFIATILICAIGLVMVFSSSSVSAVLQYKVSTYYFFSRQLLFMALGFALGLIFLINIPISKYRYLYPFILLGVLSLLILLPVYGMITNGANSWFRLGKFSLQPSEFAKTAVIIYMASFFGQHINSTKRFFFIRPIIVCIGIVFLIFIQPDLGTTAIVSLTVFFMFMAIPFKKDNKDVKICKILGSSALILVVLLMLFGGELLNSEQTDRLTYKEPCTRYTAKTGYQVCNGMIAMNNGGLFGVGLGHGSQKYLYLPEGHTDFIFPIVVEELGGIASAGIILVYMFMLFRMLKISKTAKNLSGSLIAFGSFLIILIHLFVNFGGILALIPLTGVPVPLMSYGGSFTLNTLILIFLTLRVSVESNMSKEKYRRK